MIMVTPGRQYSLFFSTRSTLLLCPQRIGSALGDIDGWIASKECCPICARNFIEMDGESFVLSKMQWAHMSGQNCIEIIRGRLPIGKRCVWQRSKAQVNPNDMGKSCWWPRSRAESLLYGGDCWLWSRAGYY